MTCGYWMREVSRIMLYLDFTKSGTKNWENPAGMYVHVDRANNDRGTVL